MIKMSRPVLVILLLPFLTSQVASHGFPRGYRNSRTWGTGPQRSDKTFNQRRARQFEERMSACSSCTPSQVGEAVCGTDGRTYNDECSLKKAGCKNVRRQGTKSRLSLIICLSISS